MQGTLFWLMCARPASKRCPRLPGPLMFTREDFERVKAEYKGPPAHHLLVRA